MSEINDDSRDESMESLEMDCLALSTPKKVNRPWTRDDELAIDDHIKYHTKMIQDLNTCLVEGPNKS
jgi:hypothetical protein